MPPARRRGTTAPDPEALATLSRPGRLTKAPDVDPVLGGADPAGGPDRAPAAHQTPPGARTHAETAGSAKTKVGFYAETGDINRSRAAYANLPAGVRPRTYSDFLAAAVMDKVEQLEAEYNDGHPWEPLQPGTIATGRPMSS